MHREYLSTSQRQKLHSQRQTCLQLQTRAQPKTAFSLTFLYRNTFSTIVRVPERAKGLQCSSGKVFPTLSFCCRVAHPIQGSTVAPMLAGIRTATIHPG